MPVRSANRTDSSPGELGPGRAATRDSGRPPATAGSLPVGTRARMKAAIIGTRNVAAAGELSRSRVLADFAELVKARLTLLVLLTTTVGFYLAADNPTDYLALFHTVFGTAAAA